MKNTSLYLKNYKRVGRTKHFPAATKEWKDSVYTYDKNYLRSLPVKHNMANKLTTSHFYIHNQTDIARSHRMRSLIMKSSSKKIFISKPDIKHSTDKTTLTIYNYDRQKQSFAKNLGVLNKKLSFYLLWLAHHKNKKVRYKKLWSLDNDKNKLSVLKKQRRIYRGNRKIKKIKIKTKNLSFFGNKFINEINFLRFRTRDVYKNLLSLNYGFSNLFTFYILSLLNIKMIDPSDFFKLYSKKQSIVKRLNYILDKQRIINFHSNRRYDPVFNRRWRFLKKENYLVRIKFIRLVNNIIENKPNTLLWLNVKSNSLEMANGDNITKKLLYEIAYNNIFYNREMSNDKQLLNYNIWKFIENNIMKQNIITKNEINYLYKNFISNKYKFVISKLLKKKSKLLYEYAKLELNNLKHNNLLSSLKLLMNNIYNKKIELNIVKLKYINLNSDVYTQAIVTKLKKKVSLLKVLRKSLKLIKLPNINIRNKRDINNLEQLNIHLSLKINKLFTRSREKRLIKKSSDLLSVFINRIYPNNLIYKGESEQANTSNTKIINILNTIRYKWISGVRLEAAGRLTRRNTAARSAFKIRYKGNLKNRDNYVELDRVKTVSTVMMRNHVKANSQYTYVGSRRRIGSFGIKSWINSY